MKKYYTADKETGAFIQAYNSISLCLQAIEDYEEADREEGTYEPDFYDIVDEDHCHVDIYGWYLVDQKGFDRWETRLKAQTQAEAFSEALSEWNCMSEYDRKKTQAFYIAWCRETTEGYDDEREDKVVNIMDFDGSKLQLIRKSSGLTAQALADKSGVNFQMIQKYETGVKDINKAAVATVKALANALGCRIEDLID